MDKRITERVAKVGKGMCEGFFTKKEIENTHEDYICIQGYVVLKDTCIC
jgi:hypothetical protein